CPKGSEDFDYW
nr:immunoglobulin heavy chain junction region [Macaca mulatta]